MDINRAISLLRFFETEPTNLYHIANQPGWNNPTTHRYIRSCVEAGYLEFDHEEHKTGIPSKFYRITEKGKALLTTAPAEVREAKETIQEEKKPRKEEKRSIGIFIRSAR